MKTLYFECNMGAAGDMLCASMLDMLSESERKSYEEKFSAFLHGVSVSVFKNEKRGITGTKFDVNIEHHHHHHDDEHHEHHHEHHHHHHHTAISEIFDIIDGFDIDEKTKTDAKAVYKIIADAESLVHGMPVADVHLHEVGAKDAIIDVTSACFLINKINPDRIIASPITTGFGSVNAAHGVMPVPAPATAQILRDIPSKSGDIEGELCTPTGAALLKYFADEFTTENEMTIKSIGYGMGTKDFERANCVRAFLGDTENETVFELRCQVDDMTGEEMGYCINKLISLGANDAFVKNIVMKKSRPAFELTVICKEDKKDYFTEQIFKHTTTIGVRQVKCARKELQREITECGAVNIKRSEGYGTAKEKIEFDDLASLADEKDISIFEARREALKNLC